MRKFKDALIEAKRYLAEAQPTYHKTFVYPYWINEQSFEFLGGTVTAGEYPVASDKYAKIITLWVINPQTGRDYPVNILKSGKIMLQPGDIYNATWLPEQLEVLGIDYEIYQDPYAITKKDIERFLRENPEYNR